MSGGDAPACVAIIPARYGSSRFPGKPLALLEGRPLVVHVLQRVQDARLFDRVWVATDDERIASVVRDAGGEAFMTRADHETGTERVAELAVGLPERALVVNVQGDEPLLPAALLHELVERMRADDSIDIATAAHPCRDAEGFASSHVVKVVVDARDQALYFSRAPIPHSRPGEAFEYLRHVGIYGFRRGALLRFVALPRGGLEAREGLEQLRALENGMRIHVLRTRYETLGVDTPDDLKAVAKRLFTS